MKKFSLIIPIYNEEKIIVKNTERLIKFLNKFSKNYQIILCDNGSTDETPNLGKRLEKKYPKKIKFIRIEKRGVGHAFKKAVLSSSYNNLISMDMDLSVDLNFIPKCLKLLNENSIVVGSKTVGSQERLFYRRFISESYILLTKFLLGINFSDYSIGAKGYRKKDIIGKIKEINSGSFYVNMLIYYVKKKNKKVVEIPVFCHDTRKSKFNLMDEIFYRLKNLLSFWFREKIINKISKPPAQESILLI